MSEKGKGSFIERMMRLVLRETLGGIAKPAERLAKRLARAVGLIIGGIVLAILGIAFLSVGAVKWLAVLMPSWLGWIIVGIVLFLLGIVVTSLAYTGSRR